MVNQSTLEIIATTFGKGSTHDFRIFKDNLSEMASRILCLADSGYLGIGKLHANSRIPARKSKRHPLTAEQRAAIGIYPGSASFVSM